MVYKRGKTWWYQFVWHGERFRASTKTSNKRTAEQIEAAQKTALAMGAAGITEAPKVPTLAEFAVGFEEEIKVRSAEKPRTVAFYLEKLKKLLADRPLSRLRLDKLDEAAVDAYTTRRAGTQTRRKKTIAVASINRELATLRRLMRLAFEWKVIARVPRIRLLRGEIPA
ncbi:MAG: hypothetical protein QM757_01250 [Paludibaculum sp.]